MSSLSAVQEAFGKQPYLHQKLPTMQLMSMAAKFQGKSNNKEAAEQINLSKTEVISTNYDNLMSHPASDKFAFTAPPIQLMPNPNYKVDVRPKSAAAAATGARPSAFGKSQPPSQIGALLSQEEVPLSESDVFQPKIHISRDNGDILSGIAAEDPYRTSNQAQNESYDNKKPKPKTAENVTTLTSPITGELLGDFGTWRQEAQRQKEREILAQATSKGSTAVHSSVYAIISKLKEQLVAHGAKGIIGLSRKFKIMDDDGSNSLSLAEFTKAFKEIKMKDVSTEDIKKVFDVFDRHKHGYINFDSFLEALAGPLNQRRKALVNMAFDVMDKDGNGVLEPSDVISAYNCSMHPEVMSGKRTKEEVLREFLDGFDIGGVVDGKVTREEFENYYQKISASIDNEDYFELMIRNAWRISGGEGQAANTANRRVFIHRKDGSSGVEEIKNDLGLRANDREEMMRRLQAQGVDATKIDTTGAVDDDVTPATKSMPSKFAAMRAIPSPASKQFVPTPSNNIQNLTLGSIKLQDVNIPLQPPSIPRPKSANTASNKAKPAAVAGAPKIADPKVSVPPGLSFIIKRLKDELKSRGANGFAGLQRKFKIMDDDGSRSLCQGEFKKAMNEMKLGLADPDLRRLFEFFDCDRSGYIDFDEFINGLRDPLNDRRLKLVKIAFSKIDKDGSGVVDTEEALSQYDVSRNPMVMSGAISKNEAILQFLQAFEVGGEKDGFVTLDEFTNYYANIGASIENEDYFELMIRNSWRISGGEGQAANTANRRVLVHGTDGRIGVHEIQHELGLKANDKAGMMARLQSQGINATKIDTSGAVDDDDVNVIERLEETEAKIIELKKKAVTAFNEKRFNFAEQVFQEIASLIQNEYPGQEHPELSKAQKSVQLIKKKIESLSKTKK